MLDSATINHHTPKTPITEPHALEEHPLQFGGPLNLSGIVTLPDRSPSSPCALILLNSGMMHRVGSGRTSVELARQAAARGLLAFRFDLSGIGDSPSRTHFVEERTRINEEINQAIDLLQHQYAVQTVYLYGLCSGAQNAFHYAVADTGSRVSGLIGIDQYAYPTLQFYCRHYIPKIIRSKSWLSLIKQIVGFSRNTTSEQTIWPSRPPRAEVQKGYQQLVERGLRHYMIYTGSWRELYNYPRQLFDMFPKVDFNQLMTIDFIREASHTLPEPRYQQQVITRILDWITNQPEQLQQPEQRSNNH